MRSCVALVVLVVACGKREAAERAPEPTAKPPVIEGAQPAQACDQQPFADTTPIPEASGAAWMNIGGTLGLVVVADSGHDGAFGILDPDSGETRTQGLLPLGTGAGDDIEGLATRADRLYGLTSAGYMRVWEWAPAGFQLVAGPYPIGSGEDICDAHKSNCGRDYEGLALAPVTDPRVTAGPDACVGFACARADGSLYCLVERDGKLQVDRARRITVETRRMAMSDCAFGETGTLYTGNNLFGMAQVRRVDGWGEPATARVVELEILGTGFPEVIAVRGDVIYRLSDMGGDGPSLMAKFRCKAPAR